MLEAESWFFKKSLDQRPPIKENLSYLTHELSAMEQIRQIIS